MGPDRGALNVAPESLAPVDQQPTTTTSTTSGVPKPIANGTPPVDGGPWGQNRNHASIVSSGGVPGPITTVAAIEAGKPQSWGESGGTQTTTTSAAPSAPGVNWSKGKGAAPSTAGPQPPSSGPTPTPASTVTSGSSWLKIVSQPRPQPVPVAPTTTTTQQQAQAPPAKPTPGQSSQAPVEDMTSLAPVSSDGDQLAGTGLSASDKTVGPPSKTAPGPSSVQR